MKTLLARPMSLQARIALVLGAVITLLWIISAIVTSRVFLHEFSEQFDRELRGTAERIVQIALRDKHREDEESDHSVRRLQGHKDKLEFVVWSADRGIILQSEGATALGFPTAEGFSDIGGYRVYVDHIKRFDMTVAVAQHISERNELAWAAVLGMSLPLVVVIPLSLIAIVLVVRRGFTPVTDLRREMARRGPHDLSPIAVNGMVPELAPLVRSTNKLIARLSEAFEAERSFASNAAHELRTPVAGAIAQAQRLRAESTDAGAIARATEIEATLKRLNRYTEKLMQLARAEGSRLRTGTPTDIRAVVRLIVQDFERAGAEGQITLKLPDQPVHSDLDMDALGILLRNLVENAIRHGNAGAAVTVELTADGELVVANDCPPVSAEHLARLTQRFNRGNGAGDGTGLGLAIVHVIADRSRSWLTVRSPRTGSDQGFEVRFRP
ncbi:ATP-binding protein [Donghicola mangrovi]|uniref:histidine kinase n=1 Tax=Donghicola mangrovi TaxID=2729614 RepID=A0A850Q727_9RHOB|nr:ATP-binding protein [Donghicola mangrovi]NVO23962.1 two-component sensor histidine kinase [Donghicola mangrovi]